VHIFRPRITTSILVATALACASLALAAIATAEQDTRGTGAEVAGARKTADAVFAALSAKNADQLASLVDPDRGVRISPTAYIIPEKDVVLYPKHLATFWLEPQGVYTWGDEDLEDDSSKPIELTPGDYVEHYMGRVLAGKPEVRVNDDQAQWTTGNNAQEKYPNATRVEYSTEDAALRLMVERIDGVWRLVGIASDGGRRERQQ
jgi:hypothetical protein